MDDFDKFLDSLKKELDDDSSSSSAPRTPSVPKVASEPRHAAAEAAPSPSRSAREAPKKAGRTVKQEEEWYEDRKRSGTGVKILIVILALIAAALIALLVKGYLDGRFELNDLIGAFTRTPAADVQPQDTAEPQAGSVIPEETPAEETSAGETPAAAMDGEQALLAAQALLSDTALSYDGLVARLTAEGYTADDAKYAADNCGADWSAQALKAAAYDLSFAPLSYSGLMAQLESDGFTAEQAQYAADNCLADWMEQAARAAAGLTAASQEDLIQQLQNNGFTAEEAAYGAERVGN